MASKPPGPDLVATAYHEAGHAAAYLAYRRTFRYVTIRARHNRGWVAVHPLKIDRFTKAVISFAGPLAQARYELSVTPGAELDALGVMPIDFITAAFLDGGDRDLESIKGFDEDQIHEIADRLLEDHWPVVAALAAGLLARGTVRFPDAVTVAAAAMGRALG